MNIAVKNASIDVAVRIACNHVYEKNASTYPFERKATKDVCINIPS